MKQKVKRNRASDSGNVIRTILREELKSFATKEDIKEELKKFEKSFEAKMDIKLDLKLGDLETRVDEKAKQYRDQILTSNDKLMKELEKQREEGEIGDSQIRERLKVLESA